MSGPTAEEADLLDFLAPLSWVTRDVLPARAETVAACVWAGWVERTRFDGLDQASYRATEAGRALLRAG